MNTLVLSATRIAKSMWRSLDLHRVSLRVIVPLTIGACAYLPLFTGSRFDHILHILADSLWSFAFVSALLLLWKDRINTGLITLTSSAFIGFEYAQAYGIFPGTPDLLDVLVYFLSGILAFASRSAKSQETQVIGRKFARSVLSCATWMIFLLMAVASSASKDMVSLYDGKVPETFKGYNGVLLVELQNDKNWNKYARKAFSEEYKGAVKFIEVGDVETYDNKEEYRFLLTGLTTVNSGGTNVTYSSNLTILDRITVRYSSTGRTQLYGKLLKAYAQELERVRNL